MTRITFCYDVVSPWSLFAYHILLRYRTAWNYDLVLKPMFLGGVMKESGNKPPLGVKNKGNWMNKSDLPLFAEMSDVPYKFPEVFPINTIQCMRFLRAIEKVHPDRLEKATSLFWELVWVRSDGHKAEEAIVPEFFGKKFVESKIFTETEVSHLMEVAQSTEIKDALKNEASELVHKGYAFGFPWIIVEKDQGSKRSFFGTDRFEQIAFYLGQQWDGPKGPGKVNGRSKL